MVFHEIGSLPDVISGHRIIVYYIEGDTRNKRKLCNNLESVMEMLEKKNDDMVIFKVLQNTPHFNQFREIYKPTITEPIALFIINNEGIPLICEQVTHEDDIPDIVESVCSYCKLNSVSKSEIFKVISSEPGKTSTKKSGDTTNEEPRTYEALSNASALAEDDSTERVVSESSSRITDTYKSFSTELQIRLPDGNKDKQKFDKDALLQEVYDFIRSKFNVKEFDLKTYNRPIFSEPDYERTLEDLDLIPNGVVIVVYKNVVPFSSRGGISNILHYGFWNLMIRTTSVYRYVQGLLFTFWNSFFSSSNKNSREIKNQPKGGSSAGQRHYSNGIKSSTSRRFGNIHTLQRNDDSDDENNRYNGNSTQQK